MKSVEELQRELKIKPFEDVYSENFAHKIVEEFEFDRFAKVFDPNQPETEFLGKIKFSYLIEDIEIWTLQDSPFRDPRYGKIQPVSFPSFVELYISWFYEYESGLKKYSKDHCHPYAIKFEPNFGIDPTNYLIVVKHFETELLKKGWFSQVDQFTWNMLMAKRERAELYETELLNFTNEINGYFKNNGRPGSIDLPSNYFEDLEKIILKHHYSIKNRLFQLKLAGENPQKIESLEILSEYILNKTKTYDFFDITQNKDNKDIETENFDLNLSSQEKFIYCHKLGVIEYLKEFLINQNQKTTGPALNPLISIITGINPNYIKRLMTFVKNPDSADEKNPFNNKNLIEKINRYLINRGLNIPS